MIRAYFLLIETPREKISESSPWKFQLDILRNSAEIFKDSPKIFLNKFNKSSVEISDENSTEIWVEIFEKITKIKKKRGNSS